MRFFAFVLCLIPAVMATDNTTVIDVEFDNSTMIVPTDNTTELSSTTTPLLRGSEVTPLKMVIPMETVQDGEMDKTAIDTIANSTVSLVYCRSGYKPCGDGCMPDIPYAMCCNPGYCEGYRVVCQRIKRSVTRVGTATGPFYECRQKAPRGSPSCLFGGC